MLNNSGDREDAKDLFQNALVILYKKLRDPEFEMTSKISTYLFAIAKNAWLKKITRSKEVRSSSIPDRASDETLSDPIAQEQELNVGSYLHQLIQKIGEPCKSLITLFHFDKLEWGEIAENLGYKTAHAARNQKYKCFLKIRKLIPESDRIRLFESLT